MVNVNHFKRNRRLRNTMQIALIRGGGVCNALDAISDEFFHLQSQARKPIPQLELINALKDNGLYPRA